MQWTSIKGKGSTAPPVLSGTKAALLVALPRQAGRMRICHLTSVLTGVVCAVTSVKYVSQLGNVGKLTPVQCLTNNVHTNVLAHTFRQNKKEKETKKGKKKHYPLFITAVKNISNKLVS